MMLKITETLEGRIFRGLVGTGTHTIRGWLGAELEECVEWRSRERWELGEWTQSGVAQSWEGQEKRLRAGKREHLFLFG